MEYVYGVNMIGRKTAADVCLNNQTDRLLSMIGQVFLAQVSACCLEYVCALRKLSAGSASKRKFAACFLQDGPTCNVQVRFTSAPSDEVNLTTAW
jgi:hypothetical protein